MNGSILHKADQFLFSQDNNLKLAAFRISVAFSVIIILFAQYADLLEIYGQFGYFRSDINELLLSDFQLRLDWLVELLGSYHFSEPAALKIIFWTFIFFLVLLGIGFLTPFTALICLLFQLSFIGSGNLYAYGVDYFVASALFYCVIFPVNNQLSLDAKIFKKSNTSWIFFIRVLQIQLCLVYFFGGFNKALGDSWWNGDAMWTVLMNVNYKTIDLSFLADYPIVPIVIGWSVLLIEIGYPFFIFFKKTRNICLVITCLMHLGIAIFLGLYYFALVMIIFNLVAFGEGLLPQKQHDLAVQFS